MAMKPMARDELWDVATAQHGFVSAQQATDLGVGKGALQMLVHRGTLTRVAHGVYRFSQYPVGQYDSYMLAVLWTRAPEASLSHETALDAYGISDINPNRIDVTVAKHRRLRRTGGDDYMIHREDLAPTQIGWWQEIQTVTPATAIASASRTVPPPICSGRPSTGDTPRAIRRPPSVTSWPRHWRSGTSDERISSRHVWRR